MIDDTTFFEFGQEMIVIREIFDGAHELFENELERAFEFGCPTIVIEPCRLGDETARWIWFGEYLTRYSIVTGVGSIVTGLLWPDRIFVQSALLGTALLAHGIHLVSWQQDICSNYRVESDPEQYLQLMATQQQQTKYSEIDTVSLVTSTQEFIPGIGSDSGSSDDKQQQQQQQSSSSSPPDPSSAKRQQQNRYRPTNPYEMILSTSARRQRPPVVLCRRSNDDLRRSNWINAAVSLLAIAFSFIRLVRSSFFHHHHHTANNKTMITTKSTLNQNFQSSWSSFLKTLI
ncbi:Transmembrane protein 11, mitochondrial [Dermatophagoides farinae]|uniref:Transmembrane protein 11, mitochondrial n=1 Tax=Dermatophagoides farinae TaxID=6954 RepID=A0A922HM15_DERFA|nr:Transmembrane protein 11, mitochondrial [Dermatophagoides farinae]